MKPLYYLVLAVVGGFLLYFIGQCQGRESASRNEAVDSFNLSVKVADSVERVLQPQIAAWQDSASKLLDVADSMRAQASRLVPELRSRPGNRSTIHQSFPSSDSSTVPLVVYDSLNQAYTLMVRVDSLNRVQLAVKDSIIAAQSEQIEALRRVRTTGQRAVQVQTCTILGLVRCPSRTTVGLVAFAGGIILGYELTR